MNALIETFGGHTFAPLAPNFADVRIQDIAHALANQCRFSGHTKHRYSVAEHSVRVSELLDAWGFPNEFQTWGLLHDASEAYLVDLPSPIKLGEGSAIGREYRAIESKLMAAICRRFGLPVKEPGPVVDADRVLLATEVRDLMHGKRKYWKKIDAEPLPERIRPWGEGVAEAEFLRRYRALTGDER